MGRPVGEATLGQALLTQPEALSIIDQDLDRRGPTVPEHEYRPLKGVLIQLDTAEPGQTVNAFTEVGGLDGHQDPHMRGQLDH